MTPDPADGAILVRCQECSTDHVCWPNRSYPLAPVVEHGDDGTHSFRWLPKQAPHNASQTPD